MFSDKDKAEILVDALPYIQEFYGTTVVVKYGGNAMIDETLKENVMRDVALMKYVGIRPILVHGGGPEITEFLKKVGKETMFVSGLRVTDEETVEIAEMVLVGKLNSEIGSLLNLRGVRAVGLSGKDAGLIRARRKNAVVYEEGTARSVDIGLVGEVAAIDTGIIIDLLNCGYVPVILGTGSNNTRDAVYYTERAKKRGADYALAVTPYYNKPSDEGVFLHFEALSKVGIPIIVYNIAGRTGKNIGTDLLMRIAELPNIAGVKEASGNITQMMDVIASISRVKPGFSVLSGDDALTVPLIAAGGDGVVSVVSNVAPEPIVRMVHAALGGDMEKARDIHYRLLPFFKAAFIDGNPSSIKYAMKVKNMCSGALRLPLTEVTDSAKKIIENAIKECNI